jgi:hypothetical protein
MERILAAIAAGVHLGERRFSTAARTRLAKK